MYCTDFSAFVIEMLLVKDQSSFYEIRSLAICINIKALNRVHRNSWIFWKHFCNIWNFILPLVEDYLALKLASQIAFLELVAYKPVAYKKVYVF